MGYCMAQTSLSHTYGNVACFIAEYVKGFFPADYFNTVHISSTIAYKQFTLTRNLRREFTKKKKPMLTVRPRIELFDSNSFLYNTLLTTRMTDNFYDTSFTNLQEFLLDNENGMELKFLLNRLIMNFDVTIVNDTFMEQLDNANFLKNRMRLDSPFMLGTALESYIPREILELISKDMDVPIYDSNNSPKPFLDYLNSKSIYPVSYKLRTATGNDEFFRFYPANIMTTFSGLSVDDGNRRGQINDAFTTTLSIRTEFDGAGLYYYFTKHIDRIDKIIGQIRVEGKEKDIIPMFTISNLYTESIAEGWTIFTSSMYHVEYADGSDFTDFSPLFATSNLDTIIADAKKTGVPLNTFIVPIVMMNNQRLTEGTDFIFDYDKFTVETKVLDIDATYRLVVHINANYVNEELIKRHKFNEVK